MQALRKEGWEHFETLDLPDQWWAARVWRIRSVRDHFGAELVLTFVGCWGEQLDVTFDDLVSHITVSPEIPADYRAEGRLPFLTVPAHDFPQQVESFVAGFRALIENKPISVEEHTP